MDVTRRLVITGRVQGVGYRWWFESEARRRGLHGWVRNRVDGSVEAMLQGHASRVDEMIALARRGPATAQVADVQVSEGEGRYAGFDTLPTA